VDARMRTVSRKNKIRGGTGKVYSGEAREMLQTV